MNPELKTQNLEHQRSWYLANLGIVRYVTRGSMPVADALRSEEKAQASSNSESLSPDNTQAAKSEKPAKASTRAPIIDLGDDKTTQKPATSTKTARAVDAQQPLEQAEDTCNFRLACWQVPDQILVLDSLEPGKYPEPARVQMITRLLQAVKKLTEDLATAETIDWPPGSGMIGNWQEARQMMAVYLEARQTRAAYPWVLVMGEIAAKAVQADKTYQELLGQQLDLPGGAKGVVVRGITEMLMQPETKKETWDAIRFLAEK